ncbi:MAG TPA: tRNA 2-thiouridine(34) synthase MnmA [Thermodesulfovibrionales bacterium]|nr:tRNA 2-thiouridine(34) synthase MnmA [Thermodesulfovibrionales bacterium]
MKVIVGMSGGVDSSVAAYLLKQQGYEVEGVSFILGERRIQSGVASACCSLESLLDARKTAEKIGIGHSMVNLRNEFTEQVIEPFVEAYEQGFTPNPCILCNEKIKFSYLLKAAEERGADFIATGHYARVERSRRGESGSVSLKKGIDSRKDQSYVLYVLRERELSHLTLPLGGKTKDEVREIARSLGLPSAKRPESQEICFAGGRNYVTFLESLTEGRGGPLVEAETGRVLGRHRGIHLFTIGQRKRIGVATGRPLYVSKIDPSTNTVYVGPEHGAKKKDCVVGRMNWLSRGTSATEGADDRSIASFRATVKVRSTMKDQPATIVPLDDTRTRVVFDENQWAPAPGQSAVFYDGESVIGGGVIC